MKAVAAIVVLVAAVAVYATGRLDSTLYHVGLNLHTCVENGFGDVLCGDDLDKAQNLRKVPERTPDIVAPGQHLVDVLVLETALTHHVALQTGVSSVDVDVTCPRSIEVRADKGFTCTATSPGKGKRLKIAILLTDAEGGYEVVSSKRA